jgi:SRSO17 transposase
MTLSRQLAQATLDAYFDGIGRLLGRVERRANFALYAMGLLSHLERKSVEPIAALTAGDDPVAAKKLHDNLLNFTSRSPWSDDDVRAYATDYALPKMLDHAPLDVWIVDDTGFLKQGQHSVGVQRQYTGTAGKVTNCQVAVSLTVATRQQHLPVDMALYLPNDWVKDKERREEAKILDDLIFRTKPEIALDVIAQAVLNEVPLATLCADSGYGYDKKFRGGVTQLGFAYALGVHKTLLVRRRFGGDRVGQEQSLEALAASLPERRYTTIAWAEGTKTTLSSRFAYVRVQLVDPDSAEEANQGLLIEWPEGDKEPAHYTLVTLPKRTALPEVVRKTKARWRVEAGYQEMKGELGPDHYEGRSWVGWNHHVSLVLACYALTIACKLRAFPPSAGGTVRNGSDGGADDAARGGLAGDGPSGPAAARHEVAA